MGHLHYFLLSHKPRKKKSSPLQINKGRMDDKKHANSDVNPIHDTKNHVCSLKNTCHILLFSELVCSCIGVCRILRNKFNKKWGERERDKMEPQVLDEKERRQTVSPVQKTAAVLGLCPKHYKTEREKWS